MKGKKTAAEDSPDQPDWQPPASIKETVERAIHAFLIILPHVVPTKPGTDIGSAAFEELHRLRDHMLETLEQDAANADNPSPADAPANKGGSK